MTLQEFSPLLWIALGFVLWEIVHWAAKWLENMEINEDVKRKADSRVQRISKELDDEAKRAAYFKDLATRNDDET